jgi:hypothetical protein
MKGQRGPFQTSITIHVQNLVVTSPDVGRVLRWDPERGIADTSFSYNIECAQKKQVQVKVRIYGMNRNLVYELTEQKICPGSYSFTWDGTVNTGYYEYYEYPPDEWSNTAPAGLYTFDVEVIANPYDRDAVRSQALTVVPGPVEYLGYDDGGTPDDESDDNHLYYLRWYALYSGRDASYGEIWLYDPDLERVQSWIVPVLQCVVHENCDGLTANPNGEIHGVIIPVPVSLMDKAGTYRFVLHFYDDYADTYKNHHVKAALEVNAFIQSVCEVYTCICPDKTYYPDKGDGKDCICYNYKLGCQNCPAFRNYCPCQLGKSKHPECQCPSARNCRPDICSLCKAIRDRLGNVRESPGYVVMQGYGQVEFYVRLIVRRKGKWTRPVTIQLKRPNPRTEWGEKDRKETATFWRQWEDEKGAWTAWSAVWKVTQSGGRWKMWVAGQQEIFKDFKVNKRAQIVITALSWLKATSTQLGGGQLGLCNTLTAKVYNHVGIKLPIGLQDQYNFSQADTQEGCLIFYSYSALSNVGHVGIKAGIYIIDINCAQEPPHQTQDGVLCVDKHPQATLVGQYNAGPDMRAPKDLEKLDKE